MFINIGIDVINSIEYIDICSLTSEKMLKTL